MAVFGRKGTGTAAPAPASTGHRGDSDSLAAQIKRESGDCHTLVFAAKIVGFAGPRPDEQAPRHITVADIDNPSPTDGRGGPDGLSFQFIGQHGEAGTMFFFAHGAAIWPDGEASPRRLMPAEDLRRYVPQYPEVFAAVLAKVTARPSPVDYDQMERIRQQLKGFGL